MINSLKDVIIDPDNYLVTCVPIKHLSGEEIFIKKGKCRGYREITYIKFQSTEKYKISGKERAANIVTALAKTIFSLGLALFSKEIREEWACGLYGKKAINAYIAKTLLDNERVLTLKQLVIKAVSYNGRLQDIPTRLQDDEETVLAGISYGNAKTLEHASARLRAKASIVSKAVEKNGRSLPYASEELQKNREIVLKAMQNFGDINDILSEDLKNDHEIRQAFEGSNKKVRNI